MHGARTVLEVEIKTSGGLRDIPQALLVQLRFYDLTLSIFNERILGVLRPDWDQGTLWGSDTDGENADACVGRGLRGFKGIATQFLPVCKNDEGAIARGAFPVGFNGKADGFGNVGAALRNRIGAQIVDCIDDSSVIDR